MFKKLISLFKKKPIYSEWIDIGFYTCGYDFLLQMRYNLKTNRKEFNREKIGSLNSNKNEIITQITNHSLNLKNK